MLSSVSGEWGDTWGQEVVLQETAQKNSGIDEILLSGKIKLDVTLGSFTDGNDYFILISELDGLVMDFQHTVDTLSPNATIFSKNGRIGEEYAIDYCSYDVYDKFINLEFNVKDSNGGDVTVVDGKFTPTLAGEYTIELIATDRTGNSTTVTKTITIAEAPNPPAPPTPPQDDNQGGNSQPSQTSGCGCAGTFNVSSFILTLSAAVVICFICKKIGKTKI